MEYDLNIQPDLVCWYFVEEFCVYIHKGYWSTVFFCSNVFIWLWYEGNAGLVEWVWKYSLIFYFLGRVWGGFSNNSLNVWCNSPVKPSDPGLFFVGRSFWLLIQSLCLLKIYSDFLFLIRSVLVVCVFLGTCPFHLVHLICWCAIIQNILLILFFYKVSSSLPIFIRDFSNLSLFSFLG